MEPDEDTESDDEDDREEGGPYASGSEDGDLLEPDHARAGRAALQCADLDDGRGEVSAAPGELFAGGDPAEGGRRELREALRVPLGLTSALSRAAR